MSKVNKTGRPEAIIKYADIGIMPHEYDRHYAVKL